VVSSVLGFGLKPKSETLVLPKNEVTEWIIDTTELVTLCTLHKQYIGEMVIIMAKFRLFWRFLLFHHQPTAIASTTLVSATVKNLDQKLYRHVCQGQGTFYQLNF